MSPIRRISDLYLGSIFSTKVISITSSETLYEMSSGARAVEVTNIGTAALLYFGASGLLTNSGGVFINTLGGAKMWDSVIGTFQMAFRAQSAGVSISTIFHEYAGN